MKILVMYKMWGSYLPRFVVEGERKGVEVKLEHFTELKLETKEKGVSLKAGDIDVKEFDLVYVRSVGQYHEEMTLLADYCKTNKVKLLETALQHGNVDRDHKSYEALKLLGAGLGYPKSFFSSAKQTLKYLETNKKWPVVIKDTGGRRGRGVYKVGSLELAEKIFQGRVRRNYVVQDYIKNDGEYRVWVIGGKYIGAMHRPVREGQYELVGIMGKSTPVKLGRQMRELAINAAAALEIDVAGIDMVKDVETGCGYVLEVNRAGVFGVFEKVTGLNIVGEIMDWLIKQGKTGNRV